MGGEFNHTLMPRAKQLTVLVHTVQLHAADSISENGRVC